MQRTKRVVPKRTWVSILIVVASLFTFLFSGGMNCVNALAIDYSTIRVKLTNVNDGSLNINLKGNYSIDGKNIITGEVLVKNTGAGSLNVYKKTDNTLLYSGKSANFVRSENQGGKAGLIKMYNAYNGWCEYLGNIKITVDGAKSFFVINQLPLEHYVYGVVAHEMNNSWPLEALKAQSVTARGYAAGKISPSKSYDILDTPKDQVYKGFNAAYKNVITAVDSTKGMVLKHNGKIILPYFGASNGGQTELTKNIWTNSVSYCIMKDDPYDVKNPMSPKQTVFFPTNVSSKTPLNPQLEKMLKTLVAPKLKEKGYSTFADQIEILGVTNLKGTTRKYDSPSKNFTHAGATIKVKAMSGNGDGIVIDTSSSKPKQPTFTLVSETTNGPIYSDAQGNLCDSSIVELRMEEYEAALEDWENGTSSLNESGQGFTGSGDTINIDVDFRIYDLKDTKQQYKLLTNSNLIMYYVEKVDGGSNIVNVRFGHGVGMSQRGAQQMANEGKTYKQIINFYYDSVTIDELTYNTSSELSGNFEEPLESDLQSDLPIDEETDIEVVEEELDEEIIGKTNAKTGIYATASNKGKKLASINSGISVSVLGQKGSYILINAKGGVNGFIPAKDLNVNSAEASITKASKLVNSSNKSIATLKTGDTVTILNRGKTTYKVKLSNGSEGFVDYSNVKIVVTTPVVTLSGNKSYGQTDSDIKLYSSKSKKTVVKDLPANAVFEIISKTDNDCYNIVYNNTKGVVEKNSVTLLGKGGMHPNPEVLVKEYLSASASAINDFVFMAGAPIITSWGGFSVIGEAINAGNFEGKITGMTVNMRSEPNTSSSILTQLAEGTSVDVLGQSGEYFRVSANGKTGYVIAEFVAVETSVKIGLIKSDGVNMRSEANVSSHVLVTLTKNTKVKILGSVGEFYNVETNDGTKGYVSDSFLIVQEATIANIGDSTPTSNGNTSSGGTSKAVATGAVSGENVRLRKSASSQSTILAHIPKGSTVEIIATNKKYYKVNYSGFTGYVLSTYIPKNSIKSLSNSSSTKPTSTSSQSSSSYKTGTVTANSLNLRTESGTIIAKLQKGQNVTILSSTGTKHKVKIDSGSVGFVDKEYVSVNSGTTSSNSKRVTATAGVNIRQSADGTSKRVGVIYNNETANLIEESGEWYKIERNGTTGYVMKKYFK